MSKQYRKYILTVVAFLLICGGAIYTYTRYTRQMELINLIREAYWAIEVPNMELYNEEERKLYEAIMKLKEDFFNKNDLQGLSTIQEKINALNIDVQKRIKEEEAENEPKLILNTGIEILLGDDIKMTSPGGAGEGTNFVFGTVSKLIPESGEYIVLNRYGGIIVPYRYIVEMDVTDAYFEYDDAPMPLPEIISKGKVLGIVYLDNNGEEHIWYLKGVNEDSGDVKKRDTSGEYRPYEVHGNIVTDKESMPKDILELYESKNSSYSA